MPKDFIASIVPGACPECYSNKTIKKNRGFTCLECENEWSEEDANFAQGMIPDSHTNLSREKNVRYKDF